MDVKEVASLLSATPKLLRVVLHALPAEVCRWRPEPEAWCINEVVGHIIEADRNGFAGRIQEILAAPVDGQPLKAWDIEGAVIQRRDRQKDGLALLDELEKIRQEGSELVARLQPTDLSRYGRHPLVGELRVVDILHEWIHHDQRHVKQILSNVQAYVWPHMGNAQRFSELFD